MLLAIWNGDCRSLMPPPQREGRLAETTLAHHLRALMQRRGIFLFHCSRYMQGHTAPTTFKRLPPPTPNRTSWAVSGACPCALRWIAQQKKGNITHTAIDPAPHDWQEAVSSTLTALPPPPFSLRRQYTHDTNTTLYFDSMCSHPSTGFEVIKRVYRCTVAWISGPTGATCPLRCLFGEIRVQFSTLELPRAWPPPSGLFQMSGPTFWAV